MPLFSIIPGSSPASPVHSIYICNIWKTGLKHQPFACLGRVYLQLTLRINSGGWFVLCLDQYSLANQIASKHYALKQTQSPWGILLFIQVSKEYANRWVPLPLQRAGQLCSREKLSRMLKLSHSGKHAYDCRLLVSQPYTCLSNIFKYPQYVINNYIVFME